MTSYVVFTGKAYDRFGKRIMRDSLRATAFKFGWVVQEKVDAFTNMLVASRTDTVKAKAAEARGLTVMTYPDFVDYLVEKQGG